MHSVNEVGQVGFSITGDAPDRHPFGDNLVAKRKLVLASGKAAAAGALPRAHQRSRPSQPLRAAAVPRPAATAARRRPCCCSSGRMLGRTRQCVDFK
ncbi:unnamed protein product [Urochloa humidicola]